MSRHELGQGELLDAILKRFGEDELQLVCFYMGIEYEDIEGTTRRLKALGLIKYCIRRDRIPHLIINCQRVIPEFTWEVQLAGTDEEPGFNEKKYIEWVKDHTNIIDPLVPLIAYEELTFPDILAYIIRVKNESAFGKPSTPITLFHAVQQLGQVTLVGEVGSGKTTALRQLAFSQCEKLTSSSEEAKLPIYIDLTGYRGESITILIRQIFKAALQDVTEHIIEQYAANGKLILLFDDFDLVKSEHASDLLQLLKTWIQTHPKCFVVVASHLPQDGYRLGLPTLRVGQLNGEQITQILTGVPTLTSADIVAIQHGLPVESRHLIENHLTLRMVAYVYVRSGHHKIPRSRSLLYKEVVNGILHRSEAKGMIEFERSDKVTLLSYLARWLLEHESYTLSPAQISNLITEAIEEYSSSRVRHLRGCNSLRLRTELVQSGFFQVALNGELQFIFPSLRNYFAAYTIVPQELNNLLLYHKWHDSLLFWTSMVDIITSD